MLDAYKIKFNLDSRSSARMAKDGFTLVEIMIVVVILTVLAVIALPRFSNASAIARANSLASNLRIGRVQISLFESQHLGIPPGYPRGDIGRPPAAVVFEAQMTQRTDENCLVGSVGDPNFPLGPYLLKLPKNPINGKNTVEVILNEQIFPTAGDNSHGYIYQPSTMTFKADSPGADDNGRLYFDY